MIFNWSYCICGNNEKITPAKLNVDIALQARPRLANLSIAGLNKVAIVYTWEFRLNKNLIHFVTIIQSYFEKISLSLQQV